jgi:hypothetical protein
VQGRPQHKLPVTLLPRQKLTVLFNVAFTTDCVPDPAKTTALNPDHEDYSYAATLHYSVIDPSEPVDSHSADDVCPRDPQGIDPYPNGKILDKGCGSRKPDPPHTLGGPVLTDVIVSP